MDFVKTMDLTDNPISDLSGLADKKFFKFEEDCNCGTGTSEENDSDSDSEDWEGSAPTSELDMSESSEDEIFFEDPLAAALPQVARFTGTGF